MLKVDLQDNNGWSALMSASQNGRTEVAKLLLDHHAQVDLQDNNGWSALMSASQNGHAEVAKLLLDHHAQFDLQDNNGWSALMSASQNGHAKVAKLLLDHHAQVDFQDNDGWSSLMLASDNGHAELAKLLLDHHAQVDSQDNNGWSALMYVSRGGQIKVAKLLLDHQAQVDMRENDGLSPLMIASQEGHTEGAKLLLDHHAEVDLQDNEGRSALMFATQCGHAEVTELLLDCHAQVDLQDKDGWTPLMFAVKTGDEKAIQYLIAHEASTHLKNSEGKEICPKKLNDFLMVIMQNHQALLSKVNGDLSELYAFSSFCYMIAFISLGLDLNYPEIIFYNAPVIRRKTATTDFFESMGASMHFPKDSLNAELNIHPCFAGPFELSDEYESASPAYLILHNKVPFQKDVIVRIHHHANLRNEEDCEDMTFLSASSTPEYKDSRPVYTFKEIVGSKGIFKPGDQVGEVSLRHFCLVKAAKRKRTGEEPSDPVTSPKKHQGCL